MIDSNIMSIREMIDTAFGEPDVNNVNFKIMQTILYILARQLRILERQVSINFGPINIGTPSNISVTELKLQAKVSKPKKKNVTKPSSKNLDKERKISQDKTHSSSSIISNTEKSKTDKISPSDKTSTKRLSDKSERRTEKTEDGVTISKEELRKKDFRQHIDEIEQQREYELRVVHQRANSREEAEKSPTPMASLDSMEYVHYEKLLVVERTPKDEVSTKTEAPRLSIVTQQQFKQLTEEVKELQKQFGAVGAADFPDNIQLMKELRKGASLTDAMAALQLSARLEAAEKTLEQLMSLITGLASKKGIKTALEKVNNSIQTKKTLPTSKTSKLYEEPDHEQTERKKDGEQTTTSLNEKIPSTRTAISSENFCELSSETPGWITAKELDQTLQLVQDDIINKVTNITNKTLSDAKNVFKKAATLETKLSSIINLGTRVEELETQVSEYAEQINTLDTGLTSQMTHYQEQLTQMQHDLESGIESMAQAVANNTGDPIAVAELNTNFTNLQGDIDFHSMKQKELEENQNSLSLDLQALLQQIELVRDTKADRDEVTDALRDKAGLDALNGLVTQQQFDAIRGDFEKRIKAAYNKFDRQEIQWQKAIDDLQRTLDEKAELSAVQSLRDDINENLEKLRSRMVAMMEIVGEPRAAAVSKILFRDTACISCSSPAHMNFTEPNMIPALPALKNASNADDVKTKPKEDGDGICYRGKQIPHPIHPNKSHMCHRYCGGSHTATSNARRRLSTGIVIRPVVRDFTQEIGADEKSYIIDNDEEKKVPCIPCNVTASESPKLQQVGDKNDEPTLEMSSSDFMPQFNHNGSHYNISNASMTPPYFMED